MKQFALAALFALSLGVAQADTITYDIEFNRNPLGERFIASLLHTSNGWSNRHATGGRFLFKLDGQLEGDLDLDGDGNGTFSLEGALSAIPFNRRWRTKELALSGEFEVNNYSLVGELDYEFGRHEGTFFFDPMRINRIRRDGYFTLWGQNWEVDREGDREYVRGLGIDLRGNPVPEPASAALLLMGLAGAAGVRRRKGKAEQEA